jgi:hypothetical protein
MREEKAKIDLDRFAKDLDMMRWENNTWRRRELDVFIFTFAVFHTF